MPLITLALTLSLSSFVFADTIRLRADSWCPYNCEPNSATPGILIEIAKEVFEPMGHRIDYQTLSWARAKELGREGKIEGIVGAIHADAPDYIYPSVPQAASSQNFFVRKDSTWTYQNLNSLKNQKVGVINAYSYGDMADELILKRHPSFIVLSADNALEQLIGMLEKRRLTAFYEDPKVVSYRFKRLGKPMDWIEPRGSFSEKVSETFIAFSPKNPKSSEYAKALSKGTLALKSNGRLKDILKKYGVAEP